MNPSSGDMGRSLESPQSPSDGDQARSATEIRRLTWIAWLTTLLVSRLPEIVLREVLGIAIPWMAWAVVALSAALWIAARFLPTLRPLERYFAVLTVLAVMFALIPEIFRSAPWQALVPSTGHPC